MDVMYVLAAGEMALVRVIGVVVLIGFLVSALLCNILISRKFSFSCQYKEAL